MRILPAEKKNSKESKVYPSYIDSYVNQVARTADLFSESLNIHVEDRLSTQWENFHDPQLVG